MYNKSVLIIGSEGFIGKHLVKSFISRHYDVTGCDLFETSSFPYSYLKVSRVSPDWEELVSSNSFDVCINAAGSGNVPFSMTHPMQDFESNTFDVIKILDTLRRHNSSCSYLHISSAAVYGNPQKLPVQETDATKPLSPYGWHKLMSEQICFEYSQLYDIRTAVVRPFSVYGPGLKKQLFWDLFQKYLKGNPVIELFGTGKETRDFIYIKDLVDLFQLIIEKSPMQGEIYNAASGIETSIEEVANLFFSYFEESPSIIFNHNTRKGDPLNWKADISRINSLGFEPTTSLHVGMKSLSSWLQHFNLRD